MGETSNQINPYQEGYIYNPNDQYSVVPSENTFRPDGSPDKDVEVMRADIEQTRSEMGNTLNAIQEKLNPQQLMEQAKNSAVEAVDYAKEAVQETTSKLVDHAKEAAVETVDHAKHSVHDATVGKVEHMVEDVSNTVQDTGSSIVGTIKSNPIPSALIGIGLGWMLLKGRQQNKPATRPSQSFNRYTNPSSAANRLSFSDSDALYFDRPDYYQSSRFDRGQTSNSGTEGMIDQVMNTVKENPIPVALAGLSLGYVVMQSQNSGKAGGTRPYYGGQSHQTDLTHKVGDTVSDVAGKVGDTVSDVAGKVGDTVSDVAGKVGEVAGSIGDGMGNVAGGVGDVVGNVTGGVGDVMGNVAGGVGTAVGGVGDAMTSAVDGVQYQAKQFQTQFDRWLHGKPLAVGVVALSAGVTVGLLLPGTAQENKILGDARETLMEKVQETTHQTFEKVQHVTEEVGNTAKNALEEVANTAKTEAHDQGLTK